MRPAEVCGCVSSPSDSSSASSPRTVDGETPSPERSTIVFEPTGSPVAMYSSTTLRRMSRLRVLSSLICRGFYPSASSSAVTPPPRKRPRGVKLNIPAPLTTRPPRSRVVNASWSIASSSPAVARGSSSRRPRSTRSRACVPASSGSSSRCRPLAAPESSQVARQARCVPPARAGDRRHRADPDPEVVVAEPVAEVVLRAEVAFALRAAEVRGLVPAVPGRGQRFHHPLEVVLHRVGLPLELLAVGVREAGARLRLELVAGEVLRLECDRLGEVALEVVDALAGNPVDQVERDVVEAGLPQRPHRDAHVLRARAPLERLEQVRLEALRAERDAVDPVLAEQRGQAGRDGLGIGLDGRLGGWRQAREEARERGGLGDGRRAAAEEDRVDVARAGRARARAPRAARPRRRRGRPRGRRR